MPRSRLHDSVKIDGVFRVGCSSVEICINKLSCLQYMLYAVQPPTNGCRVRWAVTVAYPPIASQPYPKMCLGFSSYEDGFKCPARRSWMIPLPLRMNVPLHSALKVEDWYRRMGVYLISIFSNPGAYFMPSVLYIMSKRWCKASWR